MFWVGTRKLFFPFQMRTDHFCYRPKEKDKYHPEMNEMEKDRNRK